MSTLQQIMRSTLKDIRSKSVFELSAQELADRLRHTADAVKESKWQKKGYLTYFDETVCPDETFMVHEYRDRKELVQLDSEGTAHLVKIL